MRLLLAAALAAATAQTGGRPRRAARLRRSGLGRRSDAVMRRSDGVDAPPATPRIRGAADAAPRDPHSGTGDRLPGAVDAARRPTNASKQWGASWGRQTEVVYPTRNLHVPKAGGSTHTEASRRVHCFLASRGNATTEAACLTACTAFVSKRGIRNCPRACYRDFRGLCKTDGAGHKADVQRCAAPAIREAYADRYPPLPRHARPGHCTTILRHPFARAVSAWFYGGHNPADDIFHVGWPPVDGFLRRRLDAATKTWTTRGGATRTATFSEFLRTRAYANVFVRTLGDNVHAYDGRVVPDRASLRRALGVLRATPFAILEDMPRSYALIAHAFSSTPSTCAALLGRLRPLADGGRRRSELPRSRSRGGATNDRHAAILGNATLRDAFEEYHALDSTLYERGVAMWCAQWRRAAADPTSCVRDAFPDPSPLCG